MGNRHFGAQLFGGKDRFLRFMRWFFYSAALLLFYMVMAGGFFRGWQPILIVPLAVAVGMRQRELSASVFGAVCGLVIDIAYGRLFGFSGVLLLPGCLAASLLVSNLIKINLINFLWLNAAMCTLMGLADYFFGYVLWRADNAEIVLTDFILPAHLSAVVVSPLVYFLVKFIAIKFSSQSSTRLTLSTIDEQDEG
jgi:cell shape-determining protein MreD